MLDRATVPCHRICRGSTRRTRFSESAAEMADDHPSRASITACSLACVVCMRGVVVVVVVLLLYEWDRPPSPATSWSCHGMPLQAPLQAPNLAAVCCGLHLEFRSLDWMRLGGRGPLLFGPSASPLGRDVLPQQLYGPCSTSAVRCCRRITISPVMTRRKNGQTYGNPRIDQLCPGPRQSRPLASSYLPILSRHCPSVAAVLPQPKLGRAASGSRPR